MKKLKPVFILIIAFLICFSLAACGKPDSKENNFKTQKPSSNNNKNIFYFNSPSEIDYSAYFIARKVFIYNDFGADISYEIKNRALEKEEAEEQPQNAIKKEKIIAAIDTFNKELYSSDNYKLYNQGNRVLYLEEESIKEETIKGADDSETTNIVLNIHVTNLSYVCNYYKLLSVEDFVKAEDDKNLNPGQQAYSKFKDKDGSATTLKGTENPEIYKVLILEGNSSTSPSIDTEFLFEGKITAYYNSSDTINKENPNSITVKPDKDSPRGTYIAVMYQAAVPQNPVNWAILGPAIGIAGVFLILLTFKIVQSKKHANANKR